MSGGMKPVTLKRVHHVPDVKHSLVSVSSVHDDDLSVEFIYRKGVVKKDYYVGVIGERADVVYIVNLQRTKDKSFPTLDVTVNMLYVCHSRLARVDRNAIARMAQSGTVCCLNMIIMRSIRNCSLHVEKTTTSTPLKSLKDLNTRSGAVRTPTLQK